MLNQPALDALAAQAVHIAEFRLIHHRDMPASTHKTIRNVCAGLRDDITHHKSVDSEIVLKLWNEQTARAVGL